jgi:hypothetical protein
LAPGVSGTRQVEQTAPSSGAPQLAQKRPEAGAAQLGQVVEEAGGVVDDMTSSSSSRQRMRDSDWMGWRAIYTLNAGQGSVRDARFLF